jgi:hypothetical protein
MDFRESRNIIVVRFLYKIVLIFATFFVMAFSAKSQCPDFTNLSSPDVTCQYGSFNDPFQYTGVASGRHTIITQQGGDPYTGYQLPFFAIGGERGGEARQ